MKPISELKISKSQIEQLANNLRNIMKIKKITEAELARSLDLPLMTVRRIVLGETTDPRISTLKLIADHFSISMDSLVNEKATSASFIENKMPSFIPVLNWELIAEVENIENIRLESWPEWHPIALSSEMSISQHAFALESRPSMHPRFPVGTLLIIDPEETPNDGDVVLIKMLGSNHLSLRDLVIDFPKWQLLPIIHGSETFFYNENEHKIIGVVVLAILFTKREKSKKAR